MYYHVAAGCTKAVCDEIFSVTSPSSTSSMDSSLSFRCIPFVASAFLRRLAASESSAICRSRSVSDSESPLSVLTGLCSGDEEREDAADDESETSSWLLPGEGLTSTELSSVFSSTSSSTFFPSFTAFNMDRVALGGFAVDFDSSFSFFTFFDFDLERDFLDLLRDLDRDLLRWFFDFDADLDRDRCLCFLCTTL